MDLSLATVEQMMDELRRRGLEFGLVVSQEPTASEGAESEQYELHSSFSDSLHQAVHFLVGVLSILGSAADELEEKGEAAQRRVSPVADDGRNAAK